MRLYHFTCLIHVPEILRDGLAAFDAKLGPELVR